MTPAPCLTWLLGHMTMLEADWSEQKGEGQPPCHSLHGPRAMCLLGRVYRTQFEGPWSGPQAKQFSVSQCPSLRLPCYIFKSNLLPTHNVFHSFHVSECLLFLPHQSTQREHPALGQIIRKSYGKHFLNYPKKYDDPGNQKD